jgi:hypothetical protein
MSETLSWSSLVGLSVKLGLYDSWMDGSVISSLHELRARFSRPVFVRSRMLEAVCIGL